VSDLPGLDIVNQLGGERVDATHAPALTHAVERLCERAGIPTSHVFVVPDTTVNAFTTGSGRDCSLIAVHAGLLREATPDELDAVVGHEIGHVVHGDVKQKTKIARACLGAHIAGRVAGSAVAATINDDDDWLSAGLKLAAGVAVSLATDTAAALYTTRKNFESEYRADAYAAKLTGKPWAVASLLQKLENQSVGGDLPAELAQLFFSVPTAAMIGVETHPPTEQRIDRVRALRARVPESGAVAIRGFCSNCGARRTGGVCRVCKPQRQRLRACPTCGRWLRGEGTSCTECGGNHGI
jgi:heat shock protein HtpX